MFYIDDPKLSWKAKGLYTAALSKIEKGEFTRYKLEMVGRDGEESVASGVQELIDAGYITEHRTRDRGKFAGSKWVLHR